MDFLVAPTCISGLLGIGLEPMSPVLSRGFLTTGPPGKSTPGDLKKKKALFLGDSFFVVSGANVRSVQFS